MTRQEKIQYLGYATKLCRYNFADEDLDMLVSLYELVIAKGGDTTLADTAGIEAEVKKRHEVKPVIVNTNELQQ